MPPTKSSTGVTVPTQSFSTVTFTVLRVLTKVQTTASPFPTATCTDRPAAEAMYDWPFFVQLYVEE